MHRVGTFFECITRLPTVLNANLAVMAILDEFRLNIFGIFPKMGVKRAVFGANTRNFEAQDGILAADMAVHRVGTFIECIIRVPTVLNANLAVSAGIGEIRWKTREIPKNGSKNGQK